MGRISIYLADDLEKRLGEFKDALNLSAIAQEAFERAIKLEKLKGTDMEAAQLERLRASRDANLERLAAEGVGDGKTWALGEASYEELERVASLDPETEDACYWVAVAILGGDPNEVHKDEVRELLERLFGSTKPADAKGQGFIEGATEVYAEVD